MTPKHVHAEGTTCEGERVDPEDLEALEAMPEGYGADEREAELNG
jgi:hypothetical protein